jgi:hypothetical protein
MVAKILNYINLISKYIFLSIIAIIVCFILFIIFRITYIEVFDLRGYNPKERNVIVFNDNIDSVQNSIKKVNTILSVKDKSNFAYDINKNTLVVSSELGRKEFNISDLNVQLHGEDLSLFIASNDRKKFIKEVLFLNNNYLYHCYKRGNNYLFWYRNIDMGDAQTDMVRFIVFAEDKSEIEDLLEDNFVYGGYGKNFGYKVLDKKGKLYLLANKNAEIWEQNSKSAW